MSELIDKEAAIHAFYTATADGDIAEFCVDVIKDLPTIPASPWHRVEEPPKEEGRYWCAKKFAGHWIFTAAWYWNNVSDYTGVPVGEEDKADGFVFGEDVVYPDYWMPIEPPKEVQDGK